MHQACTQTNETCECSKKLGTAPQSVQAPASHQPPALVMSLSAERRLDFEEAFEIIGKKAATIKKDTMAIVFSVVGQRL